MKCSYCIVPSTRGKEVSIPSNIIINEIKKAVNDGVVEILLLGQNVNSYKKDGLNFTNLLQKISKIDGLKRIRFTSPHPTHMSDEFIEEFKNNPKICKNIHVPLQSGSSKILKAMKRPYTKEWFLDRCKKIRQIDDVRISTDIIVGFIGENDEDFKDTIDVVNKIGFEQIYSFIYSPRPNTTALTLGNEIDKTISTQRLEHLIKLHKTIADKKMSSYKGKTFSVLFDKLNDGVLSGYSDNYIKVKVDISDKNGNINDNNVKNLGKIKNVTITKTHRTEVFGEIA
jgi:tRNA-2-methylthio-N6-dimethylallyladenosine synthase